jgi:hypothetical protein
VVKTGAARRNAWFARPLVRELPCGGFIRGEIYALWPEWLASSALPLQYEDVPETSFLLG